MGKTSVSEILSEPTSIFACKITLLYRISSAIEQCFTIPRMTSNIFNQSYETLLRDVFFPSKTMPKICVFPF